MGDMEVGFFGVRYLEGSVDGSAYAVEDEFV